jgi:hypothetical protein
MPLFNYLHTFAIPSPPPGALLGLGVVILVAMRVTRRLRQCKRPVNPTPGPAPPESGGARSWRSPFFGIQAWSCRVSVTLFHECL